MISEQNLKADNGSGPPSMLATSSSILCLVSPLPSTRAALGHFRKLGLEEEKGKRL